MARTSSTRFVEAQLPVGTTKRLEVVLPNGVVVRGEEVATLVALVKALGA
jgi:hypothetical protein